MQLVDKTERELVEQEEQVESRVSFGCRETVSEASAGAVSPVPGKIPLGYI